MKKSFLKFAGGVLLLLLLTQCQWIDDLGEHMPVIGERCENWQCFTEGGREQSEATKRARQQREAAAAAAANGQTPPAAAVPSATPARPAAPTPFDMPPDQLGTLPVPEQP